jgi:antitoxin CptB
MRAGPETATASGSTAEAGDLETRRRRLVWRAGHRGTREMDWLLGRFVAARVADLDGEALALYERLVTMPDPELHDWILAQEPVEGSELAHLLAEIRRYHRLAG